MKKILNPPQFDVFNMTTPHHYYNWAREYSPISFDSNSGYWILSRYEDVKQVLRDESKFSAKLERVNYSDFSQAAQSKLCPINFVKLYGLSTTENPDHDRVKKVLMPLFNELFSERLKPQIKIAVGNALDKINGHEEFDIIKHVFHELPAKIIFLILGIPLEDVEKIKTWSESRLALTWGTKEEQVRHADNVVKYWRYTEQLIESKLIEPTDDLPSYLLKAYHAGELTLMDIKLVCYGLIFSGHTTTSTFLAESLKVLLETDAWIKIKRENIPFINTADELLRFCPSAFTRRRLALEDIEISGTQIPKGAKLLLVLGSANRDESVFVNPDIVDVKRKNAKKQLSLGNGFHYCIGAKLVRLEYAVVMEQISLRFPELQLSEKNDFQYDRNISIRALKTLWVKVKD